MKRTAIVAWAVGLLIGATGVWAAGVLAPLAFKPGDTGLDSSADKFEVEQKTGWITFSGNVKIKAGDHELHADRVRLNQETGDVQARGNVTIRQQGFGTWSGDYIEYNYKTGKGLTGVGDLKASEFRVLMHEATRSADGTFDAKQMQVTTCTNAPGHWHWMVTGRGRYKDNDYVEVYNAVPWLFGVPVGYLPYWYRDIDKHYGFRLIPGYTSKWGAYVLGGYVYNVYESPHQAGPSLDAKTHLDYRMKRGVAVGQDFRWDLKDLGFGKLETYYAWDNDVPHADKDSNWRSPIDEERYRFRLRHDADLTERDQFLLRGTIESDSEVSADFFQRDQRNESTPANIASLEHREHTWASGAMVSGPMNNFYSGVSRLPEGWLNIEPQPVLDSGLIYESQTRAGYLERQAAYYKGSLLPYAYYPGAWADYDTVRADTAHRLTYPMKFGDVLSVVPRAGYRGTYYSHAELDNDVYRHSADFGVEASTRLTSDWNNGVRHVIEPYVDYSYQPTWYDTDNGKLYAFDRYDHSYEWLDQYGFDGMWLPYDWHGVRPGLRNLFQTRDEHNQMRTVFDWDMYTAFQIDSEGADGGEGARLYGTKMIYSPSQKLDMRAQVEWDKANDTVAYADLGAFYKLSDTFRLGGGYLGRDHQLYDYGTAAVDEWTRMRQNLIYGGFTHDINETWAWSTYARYDLRYGEIDEVGGYVQYSLDCLVFQLRTAYVGGYTRIDGTDRGDDFRVAILMWLKAEGRKTTDEWLTW